MVSYRKGRCVVWYRIVREVCGVLSYSKGRCVAWYRIVCDGVV